MPFSYTCYSFLICELYGIVMQTWHFCILFSEKHKTKVAKGVVEMQPEYFLCQQLKIEMESWARQWLTVSIVTSDESALCLVLSFVRNTDTTSFVGKKSESEIVNTFE